MWRQYFIQNRNITEVIKSSKKANLLYATSSYQSPFSYCSLNINALIGHSNSTETNITMAMSGAIYYPTVPSTSIASLAVLYATETRRYLCFNDYINIGKTSCN
jgi:hypothetical protein